MQKTLLLSFTTVFLFWLSPGLDLFLQPFGKYSTLSNSPFHQQPQSRKCSNYSPSNIKTIVIDPGHGGRDNGCSGRNSKEKNIALSVAKKLGAKIKANYPEIKIIYTRTSDRFIPLHKRAQLANTKKADLFISLHCNAIRNAASVHGSETYVMGLHTAKENLEVTKRENESILLEEDHEHHYSGFDPDSPEGHILLSSYQNAYLDQSILLATEIEKEITRQALGKSHGVKQAGFHVLRMTAMPSVLVEMGFLTNRRDEAFMLSSNGQSKMANALFTAFQNYKYQVEVNNAKPAIADNTLPQRTKAIITQTAPTRSIAPANKEVLQYKIQLGSFNQAINISKGKWLLVDYIIEEAEEEGRMRYFATGFEDIQATHHAKKKLNAIGFKDAYIVTYKNGKRVKTETKEMQIKGY